MKILFVDDEPAVLEQAKTFLEKEEESLDIETAVSAEKELELLDEENFDAIVSDYQMPGMDGLEFLETVREERESDVPFIIFTGKGREEVAIEALNLGADRYIQKGGDPKSQYNLLAEAMVDEVEHREVFREREKLGAELSSLVEGSDDPIYIVDEDCRFTFANEEELDRHGMKLEEMIGKSFRDLHPEGDSQEFEEKVEKALKTGEPERQGTKHEGGERYLLRTLSPVENPETGEVDGVSVISKDITERKEAEERLREYKSAVEESEDMMAAINDEYVYLFANEAFLKYHQLKEDEVVGRTVPEVVGENVFEERVKPHVDRCLDGEGVRYEMKHEFPEIGERHLDIRYYPLDEGNGDIRKVVTDMEDITERKKAEEKYRRLTEEANDLIAKLDLEGVYLFANKAHERVHGYEPEELVGESGFKFIHPEDGDRVIEMFEKGLERGYGEAEYRFRSKDGSYRWIETHGKLLPGEEAILIVGRDITERKEKEEEARRERERYEELFEGANELIITTDKEGYVKRVNKRVEEFSGYSEDELVGESILKIAHPDDEERYIEFWKRILDGENPRYELKGKSKDGSTTHIIARGRPIIEDEEVVEIQYNAQDITERKRAEKRQEFLHSLLRHDLRNQINIIDGYLGLFEEYDLQEELKNYLKKAIKATRKSVDLIEEVRTLRKIEDEEVEEVDLEPLIQGAVESCKPATPGMDFQIEMECPVEGCKVEAGPLLKAVFSNLLGNSVQHSGGSMVRISNESTNGEMVCIIEDDGKGIPDGKKEKIFEKGYKKGENAGSGLGMYLVKEIANTYGGSVEVKDSELGGARFDVHLQKA